MSYSSSRSRRNSLRIINFNTSIYFICRNTCGRVIGGQTDAHANMYAMAQTLKSLPKGLFEKVCICTDSLPTIKTIIGLLPQWSENNYRMLSDPSRRCQNLKTLKFINEYVRTNPFTYRVKYTPSDCFISMMVIATKLAKDGCYQEIENVIL